MFPSCLSLAIFVCGSCATSAFSQVITTIAGTDWSFPAGNIRAADAPLSNPTGVAVDTHSNVYFAEDVNNVVARMSPDGTRTVVAGNGRAGYSGDGGIATSASLHEPAGIAIDSAGNLFIAEFQGSRVRKVTPDGIITTVA